MPEKHSLLARLREEIRSAERRGLTRYRLAKLSGVNEGTLSRFVRPRKPTANPTFDTVERLARALGWQIVLTRGRNARSGT